MLLFGMKRCPSLNLQKFRFEILKCILTEILSLAKNYIDIDISLGGNDIDRDISLTRNVIDREGLK